MKKYKILFFILIAFISTNLYSHAQAPAQTTTSAPVQAKTVILANVDLYTPQVKQNSQGQVDISFVLKTTDREHKDLDYGISLTNSEGKKVFTHIFKKTLNISQDTPVTITDSFVPPASLEGEFSALIEVTNENGLPLAFGSVAEVSLTASSSTGEAPLVALTKCTTSTEIISSTDSLSITCTFSDTPHSVSMMKVNVYRGNEKVSLNEQDISLQKSAGTVAIPPQSEAGPYRVTLQAYEGEMPVGATQEVLFNVSGTSASVISLLTDKAQYAIGEELLVTTGIRVYSDTEVELFAETEVISLNGVACAEISKTPITAVGSHSVSIPITSSCDGYTLKFSLVDSSGNILDTETIETSAKETTPATGPSDQDAETKKPYVWYGALLILLLMIGLYIYTRRKVA
jgi:hypothetical protein